MKIYNLGNRFVNTYLIESPCGYVLIDTGYAEQYSHFCTRANAQDIDLKKIKYVFLTHAHDDHAGFLNEVLAHTNAKVIMHEKALEGLRKGQNIFEGGCSTRKALWFCKAMGAFGKADHRFPPIRTEHEERLIILDEHNRRTLEEEIGGRIFDTPGHTDCSISLLMQDGALFCGDAAMNGFPSTHRITIWVGNINAFCKSWERIISLKPSIIYPGHGKPFPVSNLVRFLPKAAAQKSYSLRAV